LFLEPAELRAEPKSQAELGSAEKNGSEDEQKQLCHAKSSSLRIPTTAGILKTR
jgi:hypothetical protein